MSEKKRWRGISREDYLGIRKPMSRSVDRMFKARTKVGMATEIRKLHKMGWGTAEIVDELGCHEGQVWQAIRAKGKDHKE